MFSNSDRLNNESYFDIEDKEKKTNTNTNIMDVNINTNGAKDIKVSDEVDLAWIVGNKNAYLLKYYFN